MEVHFVDTWACPGEAATDARACEALRFSLLSFLSFLDCFSFFYDLTIVQSGAHRLELDCQRVIADRDCVVTEGVMRMAYPGFALKAQGIEVDDEQAYYLYEARMGIVWPVDREAGLLVGEESYTGADGFAGIADRKLSKDDIAELRI